MQVLFFIFSKFFPSPARESSPGISRGCSLPVTQERAQAMVRVLAAAAAVVAAVAAAIIPATTVVAAATAAATPAVIPTAAVRTTAAAEDDDQDQNDPQAAAAAPTVVPTASAIIAGFNFGILPSGFTIPTLFAVPTNVPKVSKISMNTSEKIAINIFGDNKE